MQLFAERRQMDNLVSKTIATLLDILKRKYHNNYSDIESVKLFWHNLVFLTISKVNCLNLCEKKYCALSDFVSLGILPKTVEKFASDNDVLIGSKIENLADEIYRNNFNISVLRECILSMELCVSKTEIHVTEGKVSRDVTGSYYTPYNLATAVVWKTLSTKQAQMLIKKKARTLKIADLSCGAGEFFWAAQDYMKEKLAIPYEISSLYFWGMDVDPVALQITICKLLQSANLSDWAEIISHFHLGNPLISTAHEGDYDFKSELFALNRIYASEMGINYSLLNPSIQFDIILGNPPWEKTRFEERKFFTCYAPNIALISKKNEREHAINSLKETWKELFNWVGSISDDYGVMCSKFYKHPLIKRAVSGELNTYTLFTELAYELLSDTGVCSLIVKSTLATAPSHQNLWGYLLKNNVLISLHFFDNKNKIFNIDSRERFAVVTVSRVKQSFFCFSAGLQAPEDIYTCNEIMVNEKDIATINPFTNMIPNVTCTDDLKVLIDVHKKLKLFQEVYPNCHFGRLIHLTAHAEQIDTSAADDNIPIYEGKFIEQYDGRYSTFAGMPDNKKYVSKATSIKNTEIDGIKPLPESRFFVKKELWKKYTAQYNQAFSLCWRSLTSPTNSRTTIAMILPSCPTCQSIQMLQIDNNRDLLMLLALFNSLPFDYFVRLKMPGIDLTQSVIKQIPVPAKDKYERTVLFNNKKTTLRIHILSCVYHLLEHEERLMELLHEVADCIYLLDDSVTLSSTRKMLDLLFAQAYEFDNQSFAKMQQTFPKY